MLKNLWQILMHDRLDRMTSQEVEAAGEAGLLTVAEMRRLERLFGQYKVTR